MARANRNESEDLFQNQIREALEAYREKHPRASIETKRQNSASIRVRVIDPDFQDADRVERRALIWTYLDALPEKIQTEISMLVLVTPREAKTSFANMEFEHPTRSHF